MAAKFQTLNPNAPIFRELDKDNSSLNVPNK